MDYQKYKTSPSTERTRNRSRRTPSYTTRSSFYSFMPSDAGISSRSMSSRSYDSNTTDTTTTLRTKSSMSSKQTYERGPIENLVLYYLSTLQNMWSKKSKKKLQNHPQPGTRKDIEEIFKKENSKDGENKATKQVNNEMEPAPDEYTSKNKIILEQQDKKSSPGRSSVNNGVPYNSRVYDIVLKAIEYGMNHGIVSKSGKYFWFKWNNRIKHKRKVLSRRKKPKRRKTPRRNVRSKPKKVGRPRAKRVRKSVKA